MSDTPIYDQIEDETLRAMLGDCEACLLEHKGWGGQGCCETCDTISAKHTCEDAA